MDNSYIESLTNQDFKQLKYRFLSQNEFLLEFSLLNFSRRKGFLVVEFYKTPKNIDTTELIRAMNMLDKLQLKSKFIDQKTFMDLIEKTKNLRPEERVEDPYMLLLAMDLKGNADLTITFTDYELLLNSAKSDYLSENIKEIDLGSVYQAFIDYMTERFPMYNEDLERHIATYKRNGNSI